MTKIFRFLSTVFLAQLLAFVELEPVRAYDSSVLGSRYTSTQAAGMGEQFLGLGKDGGAGLFYNPAIISTFERSWTIQPLSVLYYGNDSFFNLNGLGIQKSLRLDTQVPTLLDNPGIYTSSGWAFLTDLYIGGFAFGVLLKADTAAQAYTDNLLYYSSKYQFIPSIGTGINLIKNTLRLGYSLQWINQASGKKEIPGNSLIQGFDQNLLQGSGLSHTLALEYSTHWRALPQIDVVIRNLLGVNFSSSSLISFTSNSQGVPDPEAMMIDAALSGKYKLSQTTHLNYSIGINDSLGATQVPVLGRLGVGFELSFSKEYIFRGGFELGYPTLGLEISQGNQSISVAMFSKDVGNSYHELEDRRILFQYQFFLEKKKNKSSESLMTPLGF